MVIRTITVDWLRRQGACERGIELFKHLAGGDRATVVFNGSGFNWILNNYLSLDSVDIDVKCSGRQRINAESYPNFVRWLFRRIAANSSELLKDLADSGVDLDRYEFYAVKAAVPKGYSKNAYGNLHLDSLLKTVF